MPWCPASQAYPKRDYVRVGAKSLFQIYVSLTHVLSQTEGGGGRGYKEKDRRGMRREKGVGVGWDRISLG